MSSSSTPRTAGNPFFVRELLQHSIESGTGIDGSTVPTGISALVDQRVNRLGPEARWFLTCAAVAAPVLDVEVLVSASGLPRDLVGELLDSSLRAGLLVEVGSQVTVEFAHALIPEALRQSLGERQTSQLHRRVAEAIEASIADASQQDSSVENLAYHWAKAATSDDLGRTVGYARQAGERAMDQLAPAEACHWFQQGLDMVAEDSRRADELRCSLLVALGDAQRQRGDPAYRETLLEAGRLAQLLGDREKLVRAALANSRGLHSMSGSVDAERIAVLDAAIRVVGEADSPERARLLALHALELSWHPDIQNREALATEALEVARRLGDPATLVGVLTTRYVAIHHPETLDDRYESSRLALAMATELHDPVLRFWAAIELGTAAVQRGDAATAIEALALHVELADQLDQPIMQWSATFSRAELALLRGDADEGERLANRAFELGDATGQPDAFSIWANQIGEARYIQGRNEEIIEIMEDVVRSNEGIAAFRTALAGCYCDLGRVDDARRTIQPDIDARFRSVDRDVAWLAAMLSAADAVYGIEDALGAETLFQRLEPFAHQYDFVGVSSAGSVGLRLARLATVLERYDTADAYFAQATGICNALGAHHELARLGLDWGRMLQRRGREEDAAQAEALLRTSHASATARGYALVAQRAGAALGLV